MVTSATLKNLTDTMKMMAAAERLVGDFYRDCAEIWEEDGAFWLEIAAEEEKHATQLERMAQILTLKPERFETGRPFNRTGIQTFMNGIEGLRQRLKEGMITLRNDGWRKVLAGLTSLDEVNRVTAGDVIL